MATAWTFRKASSEERKTFPDLESALAHPSTPSAPPNRFREVRRLETAHGIYFLKCFWKTQAKNRLRNALSAPRCRLDADREYLISAALEAHGAGAARVVATGRKGGQSFFLCARIEGSPLSELGHECRWSRAVAEFLGGVLRRGIVLPDLALQHVFVLQDEESASYSIIDLHNGAQRAVRAADLRRILRRFARSARGLSVRRFTALRFAARLVHAAGYGKDLRSIVQRLSPFDTHGRYDVAGKSRAYATRNRSRHEREIALLGSVWPGRPGELVLDSPCGAGRLRNPIEREWNQGWLGADRSIAMLAEGTGPRVLCDALELPFRARSVAGVVVFRFLHHLPPTQALAAVAEAARVADRFLVVSFFHPWSGNALRRLWRKVGFGAEVTRFALAPSRLDSALHDLGFELAGKARDGILGHELALRTYLRKA